MSNIIPFGKYKGQPIEVLMNDPKYLEWLKQQDWFRNQYGSINTLIINNFQEASETPEHNKIQALFTDDDFCQRFMQLLIAKGLCRKKKGVSYKEYYTETKKEMFGMNNDKVREWEVKSERIIMVNPEDTIVDLNIRYEVDGVDVKMDISERSLNEKGYNCLADLKIEIKPSVSDDYPAILRQMKNNKSTILLTEKYTGTGATFEQVCKIFKASEINIILLEEIK